VARVWANMSRHVSTLTLSESMAVFEGSRDSGPLAGSPTPPPPQPKRYPACRKCIIKHVSSAKWLKGGVGPWAVSGAAAGCQPTQRLRVGEGKGRCDGRLLHSGRAPLEPQPHCMQKLFSPAERLRGMAVGRGWARPMLRDLPPSNDEMCPARSNARCTQRTLLLRR
jgi:hypothetical protein